MQGIIDVQRKQTGYLVFHTDIKQRAHTCTIADSFVFDDVFMLEGFEDLDFPLKVPEVLGCAVL